jgi:hypothetical protein
LSFTREGRVNAADHPELIHAFVYSPGGQEVLTDGIEADSVKQHVPAESNRHIRLGK